MFNKKNHKYFTTAVLHVNFYLQHLQFSLFLTFFMLMFMQAIMQTFMANEYNKPNKNFLYNLRIFWCINIQFIFSEYGYINYLINNL